MPDTRTALVIGGTQFMGVHLVNHLVEQGIDVTVLSRGQRDVMFQGPVKRLTADRTDRDQFTAAVADQHFDVVFDQVAYTAGHIDIAVRALLGRIGVYVFTSSEAVYGGMAPPSPITENHVDTTQHPFDVTADFDTIGYGEGKRQAEAYLFQATDLCAAAVRFPMVMGVGDTTHRLPNLIKQLCAGRPIIDDGANEPTSFIHSKMAAQFLAHVGFNRCTGPFNAAAPPAQTGHQVIDKTAAALNLTATYTPASPDSPDADRCDYLRSFPLEHDLTRAQATGFNFEPFDHWYPACVRRTADSLDD